MLIQHGAHVAANPGQGSAFSIAAMATFGRRLRYRKSGSANFDTDVLHKRTIAFIEYCLDHPGEKAVDAMARIKG